MDHTTYLKDSFSHAMFLGYKGYELYLKTQPVGNLSGTILNSKTGLPAAYIGIQISEEFGIPSNYNGTTGLSGNYFISNINEGLYNWAGVYGNGYRNRGITTSISIIENTTTTFNTTITPKEFTVEDTESIPATGVYHWETLLGNVTNGHPVNLILVNFIIQFTSTYLNLNINPNENELKFEIIDISHNDDIVVNTFDLSDIFTPEELYVSLIDLDYIVATKQFIIENTYYTDIVWAPIGPPAWISYTENHSYKLLTYA